MVKAQLKYRKFVFISLVLLLYPKGKNKINGLINLILQGDRGLLKMIKNNNPNPCSYKNTNEVYTN